jgi:predicted PurR-regulated permease PerM
MSRRGPLIFLAVLLGILLPFAWRIAQPFVTPLILAGALAMVMAPLHYRIRDRLRRPGLAALLTTLITVLLIVLPVGIVVFALTSELSDAVEWLNQRSVEEGGWPALVGHTADRVLDALARSLPVNREAIKSEAVTRIKALAGSALKALGTAFGGITSTFVTGLLAIILLYFVLRHGDEWIGQLPALVPLDPETTNGILRTVQDTIVANVNGLLAVAAGQGFLLGLGFWIAGLNAPVTWGVVGGLASMIPVVGVVLVWVPFVIGLAIMGSYGKAAMLGLWCALVVGSIDNVIRPLVLRERMKQHPVIIALSVLGGTQAFGPIGLLLGPVVISLLIALVEAIRAQLPDATTSGV